MSLDNNSADLKEKRRKKGRFEIEKIPESTRKAILKITIIILMLVIISFWLLSFRAKLANPTEEKTPNQEWQSIQQDLNSLLDTTQESFKAIKGQINQLKQLAEPTTTVELSEEEIELLKEKLLINSPNSPNKN